MINTPQPSGKAVTGQNVVMNFRSTRAPHRSTHASNDLLVAQQSIGHILARRVLGEPSRAPITSPFFSMTVRVGPAVDSTRVPSEL